MLKFKFEELEMATIYIQTSCLHRPLSSSELTSFLLLDWSRTESENFTPCKTLVLTMQSIVYHTKKLF